MRVLFVLIFVFNCACQPGKINQPKPHQYPKILFPQKDYNLYEDSECPFTIDVPQYASIVQKDFLFGDVPAGKCWFDIVMDKFDVTLHCSYYNFSNEAELGNLVNDAFEMASKHNIKASFREEFVVQNNFGGSGLLFKINGPVATPYQFYMTDSTQHFLRGSLYYNGNVSVDSVAPITDFLREDIDVLLASIKWE